MPNIAKWRKLSEKDFATLVKESRSFYELASRIGYEKTGGGTQASLKKAVVERNLDISHFSGQAWNKNQFDYSSFSKGSCKKNGKTTLAPLVALRGHQCERCKLTEWLEQPIKLEIHHKDGDRSNNELDNLELLCPNCHSYTDTFCYKTKHIQIDEEIFVQALKENTNISRALKQLGLTPAGGNYTRARELITKYNLTHLY